MDTIRKTSSVIVILLGSYRALIGSVLLVFHSYNVKQMEIEFVDNEITSFGGLAILKQLPTNSGFIKKLESLPLPG